MEQILNEHSTSTEASNMMHIIFMTFNKGKCQVLHVAKKANGILVYFTCVK